MITHSAPWKYGSLELVWLHEERSTCPGSFWTDARALVWSLRPVYCAASLHVHNHEYSIFTDAWRGLEPDALQSLVNHMDSMGLIRINRFERIPEINFTLNKAFSL